MKIREHSLNDCPSFSSQPLTYFLTNITTGGMDMTATIDDIPDTCLLSIFQLLSFIDRRICSVVCRRWLKIEGQTRHTLYMNPPDSKSLSNIFSRFDSLTELTLNCQMVSNGEEALILISQRCPNLTSLAIRFSHLTNTGLESMVRNYKGLKNLTVLKLVRCYGDWDKVFHLLVDRNPALVEVYLEKIQITDIGLKAISRCSSLEILHLVKNYECSDAVLVALAEGCKSLREVHIDVWNAHHISDQVLMAVAKSCSHLQELILIGHASH